MLDSEEIGTVTIQDVFETIETQQKALEKAKEALKDISNSPMWVETVPKDGIDKCPEQVILNANIGLIKMKKVNEILEEIEKLGVGE